MSVSTIQRDFEVSAERLFDALADQDKLGSWLGVKVSVPTRGATPVGTVRRIHLGVTTFDERIELAERPRAIDYAIVPPMPLLRHHRGVMRIEAISPTRSRLSWTVTLELAAGLNVVVLPFIMQSLSLGLSRLAKQLS